MIRIERKGPLKETDGFAGPFGHHRMRPFPMKRIDLFFSPDEPTASPRENKMAGLSDADGQDDDERSDRILYTRPTLVSAGGEGQSYWNLRRNLWSSLRRRSTRKPTTS
jgi:hypothetical protein